MVNVAFYMCFLLLPLILLTAAIIVEQKKLFHEDCAIRKVYTI